MLLAGVAIAGLAFALGRFSTFGAVDPAPATTSPEAGFARDMQVHHAQAVEMAMEIYRSTDDDDIRVLSYDIATAQAAQRGEFFDWLVKWDLPQAGGPLMAWMAESDHAHDGGSTASTAELLEQMGMASSEQLAALRDASGTAGDCLFLGLMIRHHEGAVPMAQALVQLGTDARAVEVARAIIATQSTEIDLMSSLQRGLACGR